MRTVFVLLAMLLAAACEPPEDMLRAVAYGEIAATRAAGGDPGGARSAALLAVEAAEAARRDDMGMFAEAAAVIALARAGYPADARARADGVSGEQERIVALAGLAMALSETGFGGEARLAATEAARLAGTLEAGGRDTHSFMAFAMLARAAAGDIAGLPAEASRMQDSSLRLGLLVLLAEEQARAGDFAGAITTAGLIDADVKSSDSELLLIGGLLRSVAGDSMAAMRDIQFDERIPGRIVALNRIALLQARSGDFQGAAQTIATALKEVSGHDSKATRSRSLAVIALTQALTGDDSGAGETLRASEEALAGETGEADYTSQAATLTVAVRDAIEGGDVAEEMARQSKVPGDLFFLKAMAQVRLGLTEAARLTLDTATKKASSFGDKPDMAFEYAMLATKQAELGDATGAARSANRALFIAEGLSADYEERVIAMFMAAMALARAGLLDLAQDTAARIVLEAPEPAQ